MRLEINSDIGLFFFLFLSVLDTFSTKKAARTRELSLQIIFPKNGGSRFGERFKSIPGSMNYYLEEKRIERNRCSFPPIQNHIS